MAVIKFETRFAGPPLLINPAVRHTTDQQPMSIEATPIAPTPTLPPRAIPPTTETISTSPANSPSRNTSNNSSSLATAATRRHGHSTNVAVPERSFASPDSSTTPVSVSMHIDWFVSAFGVANQENATATVKQAIAATVDARASRIDLRDVFASWVAAASSRVAARSDVVGGFSTSRSTALLPTSPPKAAE